MSIRIMFNAASDMGSGCRNL